MGKTKFEAVRVAQQLSSESKVDAIKRFNAACHLCTHVGLHITCDTCAIETANSMMVAVFDDLKEFDATRRFKY